MNYRILLTTAALATALAGGSAFAATAPAGHAAKPQAEKASMTHQRTTGGHHTKTAKPAKTPAAKS